MPKINTDISGSAGGSFFPYDNHKASLLLNFVPDLAVITRVRIDVTKLLGNYSTGRTVVANQEPVFGWGAGTALGVTLSALTVVSDSRRVAQRFVPTTSAGRVALQVFLSEGVTNDGYVICKIVDDVLLGAQQEGSPFPAHDTKSNHQYGFDPYDIGGNVVGFPIAQLAGASEVGCNFEFELDGHLVANKPYWFVLSTTSGASALVTVDTTFGSNQSEYALGRNSVSGWITLGVGTLYREKLTGRYRLQRNLSSAGATGYGENSSLGLTAWEPVTGKAFPFTSTQGNSQKVASVDMPTSIVARKDARGHISVGITCSAGAESSTPTTPPGFSRFDYSMKVDFKSG